MIHIEHLVWDSEFFGYKVGKLIDETKNLDDLNLITNLMQQLHYKLLYYAHQNELIINKHDLLEIKLVDKKTTFFKKTNNSLTAHPLIFSYQDILPNPKLINLAIQSGKFSRFNIDANIGKEKFEELYKIWITKSVNKEIAKEVIIYKEDNDIAGYLTIGEKSNRADLGMGAVDSNYRGKGIGRILFENAEKWAFDNGYNEIQIVTQGDNIAACSLYKSLGYQIEKTEYFYHIWNKA